jgi:hypothetical protein
MVQFGKKLRQYRFEPWSEYYLDYGGLKRIIDSEKKKKKVKALPLDVPPPPPDDREGDERIESGTSPQLGSPRWFGSPLLSFGTPRIFGRSPQASIGKDSSSGFYPSLSRDSFSVSEHTYQQHVQLFGVQDFETYLEAEVEKIGLFFLQVQG